MESWKRSLSNRPHRRMRERERRRSFLIAKSTRPVLDGPARDGRRETVSASEEEGIRSHQTRRPSPGPARPAPRMVAYARAARRFHARNERWPPEAPGLYRFSAKAAKTRARGSRDRPLSALPGERASEPRILAGEAHKLRAYALERRLQRRAAAGAPAVVQSRVPVDLQVGRFERDLRTRDGVEPLRDAFQGKVPADVEAAVHG